MKILMLLVVAMATLMLPGCLVRGRHGGIIAVFPKAHVHSHNCGHYHHNGSWFDCHGHTHGHGCGHHHVNGVWIIRD